MSQKPRQLSPSSPLIPPKSPLYPNQGFKPILFHHFPASNPNSRPCKLRCKLPNLASVNLDPEVNKIVTKRSSGRKLLRYTSKVEIRSSCPKIPAQLQTLIRNCKTYTVQSNNHLTKGNNIQGLIKAVKRTSSKNLEDLQIDSIHSVPNRINIKRLFNLICSRRKLQSLKLKINSHVNAKNLVNLQRAFSSLHHLQSLTLITSNIPQNTNLLQETVNPLGCIVSAIRPIKEFNLRGYIAMSTCEDFSRVVDKLVQSGELEKVDLFLDTLDRLPASFYSLLAEKLGQIQCLKALGINISGFINQYLNNAFFMSLGKMQSLERLIIQAEKLNIGEDEMHVLFKSLAGLGHLKEFKMLSNMKAINFSGQYYVSFREALQHMTQLEDFTYDLRNLGSGYFPYLFDHLPIFPRLKTLSLNLTIGEGDLGNVKFLSQFLKHTKNLKTLSLKINDNDTNSCYTYQVPSEVFNILEEGLKAIPSLETFELKLGSIEDHGLNRILLALDELRDLKCLKLDAFFQGITYQAFGNLCYKLRGQQKRLREVQIAPKYYPYSNYELLDKVIHEIHSKRGRYV